MASLFGNYELRAMGHGTKEYLLLNREHNNNAVIYPPIDVLRSSHRATANPRLDRVMVMVGTPVQVQVASESWIFIRALC